MSNVQKQIIPIFYTTDDAYAPLLAVSLNSLLKNASKDYFYRVHILTSTMNNENRRKIAELECENAKISFDDPAEHIAEIADSLSLRDYYSIATYYRIFIANMFPEYEKALYIDSDTVVPGDISQMFCTDIGENLVGAIQESVMLLPIFGEYSEKVLGVDRLSYFNAGILLMNLKRWRETDLVGRFVELAKKRKFPVAQDQDYLNLLCRDRVHYFPYEYNLAPVESMKGIDPIIVHYKMASRPWNYDGIMHGDCFWKYATDSGFYEELVEIKKNHSDLDKKKDEEIFNNLAALAVEESKKAEAMGLNA